MENQITIPESPSPYSHWEQGEYKRDGSTYPALYEKLNPEARNLKCARSKCAVKLGEVANGKSYGVVVDHENNRVLLTLSSHVRKGFCSYHCNRVREAGRERARTLNGGLDKDDPVVKQLKDARFELQKIGASHWHYKDRAVLSFDASYKDDSNKYSFGGVSITVPVTTGLNVENKTIHSEKWPEDGAERKAVIERLIEIAHNTESAEFQKGQIVAKTQPRDEERQGLELLATRLRHQISIYEIEVERTQERNRTDIATMGTFDSEQYVLAISLGAALSQLQVTLESVNARLANKLRPSQSPLIELVPQEQIDLQPHGGWEVSERRAALFGKEHVDE
jgi:hypothetical protein